jgi:hypothetical protein
VVLLQQTLAQSKSAGTGTPSLCNRNDAIEPIRQQIDITRTFDNAVQRITVLIRAADLLWPFQQDKARAAFTEAFEIAAQNEKENEKGKSDLWNEHRSLILLMQTPDQRYVVIRAVAKRDSGWAKKLTEQLQKLDRQSGEQASVKDYPNDVLTAQNLLDSATQLISTDLLTAVNLARASLNYPASVEISRFLYKLSEVNQQAADQFYDQALAVYADRPMGEFLYLQAYPFAFSYGGDMPIFGNYVVPANFVTNNSLQRRFVQTLLRRAQQALEVPLDEGDNFNKIPGTGHIWQVLMRIEPQVRALLPDLSEAVVEAREKILVSLSVETQKTLLRPDGDEVSSSPAKTFDERIEEGEKTPNVNNRDELIAAAVLSAASDKESLTGVVDAIDKITDSSIREPLREWLYFRRAKDAANGKRFDEAERLVSKIEGRDQRAYLHTEIAKGLLNTSETRPHAREVLDEAITEANKAGTTIFAARTLLTASNLYAKIDLSRSISVLGEAINCINHIEAPDFSVGDQTLVKEIKRKNFRRLLRFPMPGLDPENAFREMAKIDFNDTLSQTTAFTDKFLRALTTLAVADVCLQQTQQPPKEKPKKIAKP